MGNRGLAIVVLLCVTWAVVEMPAATAQEQEYVFFVEVSDPGSEPFPLSAPQEVQIDDIVVDYETLALAPADYPVDLEAARRGNFRLYGPGTPHFGNARISVVAGSEDARRLHEWFSEASKGKNIRKNITVRLYKSDKTAGRGYNLFDCFPTRWDAGEYSPASKVQTETITVNIGRIELTTLVDGGGETGNISVEITGQSGKEVDNAWKSWSGGELMYIPLLSMPGSRYHTTTPGHKSVGEVTLRGDMTDGRKGLCEWITEVVQGKPWKRSVVIQEYLPDGRPGRSYRYFDGFPVRYVFPKMSVTNTTGNVEEEVTLKFVRFEMQ